MSKEDKAAVLAAVKLLKERQEPQQLGKMNAFYAPSTGSYRV